MQLLSAAAVKFFTSATRWKYRSIFKVTSSGAFILLILGSPFSSYCHFYQHNSAINRDYLQP